VYDTPVAVLSSKSRDCSANLSNDEAREIPAVLNMLLTKLLNSSIEPLSRLIQPKALPSILFWLMCSSRLKPNSDVFFLNSLKVFLSRHLAIGKSFSKVGSRRCTYIFGYGLGTWKPNFSIFFLSFYCPYIYRIMNSYGSSGIVCTTVFNMLEIKFSI